MNTVITTSNSSTLSITTARAAIAASAATLLILLSLHFLSPEYDPSWRMVSEYALGQYGWVLSLMFITWAVSSWALAVALWPQVSGRAGRIGLGFLVAAGVGEAMAAFFDISHNLHGLAALIGIGSLPIAAMLISISLSRTEGWAAAKPALLWTANLTWVSVVLMAASFILMMVTYVQAGGDLTATEAPATLPAGVIAVVGWTNRLLIVIYCLWVMVVGWWASQLRPDWRMHEEHEGDLRQH